MKLKKAFYQLGQNIVVKPNEKGGGFERKISKELSLWVSHGKQQDVFWRSAMSGGRATLKAKDNLALSNQSGDLSAISDLGFAFSQTFFIECKHYKNLEFSSLITGKGTLLNFWQKVYTEAINYKQHPLLIARQNYYPIIAVLSKHGLGIFKIGVEEADLILPAFDMHIWTFERFKQFNPDHILRKQNVRRKLKRRRIG